MRNALKKLTPYCSGCAMFSVKQTGKEVYPHREDLHHKVFYVCPNCEARVGCHPGTETPLGTLATESIRRARLEAHRAFDGIWLVLDCSRGSAYKLLAEYMRLPVEETHIGMFNEDQCEEVKEFVRDIVNESHSRFLAEQADQN